MLTDLTPRNTYKVFYKPNSVESVWADGHAWAASRHLFATLDAVQPILGPMQPAVNWLSGKLVKLVAPDLRF